MKLRLSALLVAVLSNVAFAFEEDPSIEIKGYRFESAADALGRMIDNFERWNPPDTRDKYLDPPAANDSKMSPCSTTKHPVIIATGEKIKEEVDFTGEGLYPLSLVRTYRSKQTGGTLFGEHWFANIDLPPLSFAGCQNTRNATCKPNSIQMANGQGISFRYGAMPLNAKLSPKFSRLPASNALKTHIADGGDDSGNAEPPGYDVNGAFGTGQLAQTAGGWTLIKDKTIQVYASDGRIAAVTDLAGVGVSYLYSGKQLTRLLHTNGRKLDFEWGANGLVKTVIDANGKRWGYEYNGAKMLTKVTPPGSTQRVTEYHYEDVHGELLTGITHAGQRYSTYAYFEDKRVRESGLAGDEEKESFTYDGLTNSVLDANGHLAEHSFTRVKGELKVTHVSRSAANNCSAASADTSYDPNGYPASSEDWRGVRTDYTFDSAGKLLEKTVAYGTPDALTLRNTWDGEDIVQTDHLNAAGHTFLREKFTYFSSGQAIGRIQSMSVADPDGGIELGTSYEYKFNANNTLARRTTRQSLAAGDAVAVETFDAFGNLTSLTNPMGHKESWSSHDGNGRPGIHTDANGITTTFAFDAVGKLTAMTQQFGSSKRATSFVYNHRGQVTEIRYPSGRIERLTYTASGRLAARGNALNQYARFDVDPDSHWTSESRERHLPKIAGGALTSSANGHFARSTRIDAFGLPWETAGNHGQAWRMERDANGNLSSVTDALGRKTSFEYDALNRVVKTSTPDSGVVEITYHHTGQIASIKDPRGLVTSYSYNGFGQRTRLQSPDAGTTTYDYGKDGVLRSELRADGVRVYYAFDKIGRLIGRGTEQAAEAWTYDQGSNGIGRLSAIGDQSGSTSFKYQADGQLVQKTTYVRNANASYSVGWNYDTAGRLTGISYPNGRSINYQWDGYGRISGVTSNISGQALIANNMLYQPVTDQRYGLRFGNSLPRAITLDTDGRITELNSDRALKLYYGYAANDDLSMITDSLRPELSTAISYDETSRLTYTKRAGEERIYTWDTVGNPTSRKLNGLAQSFVLDKSSNRLKSWSQGKDWRTYDYTKTGNVSLISSPSTSHRLEYDPFNRMSALYANGRLVAGFSNNAFNQRAFKNGALGGVSFVYGQQGELLAEIGKVITNYVWLDGELLGIERNGQFFASHNDHLGRP